jgi:hypothetical protein
LPSDVEAAVLARPSHQRTRSAGTPRGRSKDYPVALSEFNNHDRIKYVEEAAGNYLGVHPKLNFPFVNAVELIFKVDVALAKRMGFTEYRCRQNVDSQEMWERELKNGVLSAWASSIISGKEDDDPAPLAQTFKAEIIAYFDAPGLMGNGKTEQFSGPQEKLTAKRAIRVFLRQNFVGWIEGRKSKHGKSSKWERVSEDVSWHSNQSLARDILFTQSWVPADGSEIGLGHTHGSPPP